jgi:hypothetical protein
VALGVHGGEAGRGQVGAELPQHVQGLLQAAIAGLEVDQFQVAHGQNDRTHQGARGDPNMAAARAVAPSARSSTHPSAASRPQPVPPR